MAAYDPYAKPTSTTSGLALQPGLSAALNTPPTGNAEEVARLLALAKTGDSENLQTHYSAIATLALKGDKYAERALEQLDQWKKVEQKNEKPQKSPEMTAMENLEKRAASAQAGNAPILSGFPPGVTAGKSKPTPSLAQDKAEQKAPQTPFEANRANLAKIYAGQGLSDAQLDKMAHTATVWGDALQREQQKGGRGGKGGKRGSIAPPAPTGHKGGIQPKQGPIQRDSMPNRENPFPSGDGDKKPKYFGKDKQGNPIIRSTDGKGGDQGDSGNKGDDKPMTEARKRAEDGESMAQKVEREPSWSKEYKAQVRKEANERWKQTTKTDY